MKNYFKMLNFILILNFLTEYRDNKENRKTQNYEQSWATRENVKSTSSEHHKANQEDHGWRNTNSEHWTRTFAKLPQIRRTGVLIVVATNSSFRGRNYLTMLRLRIYFFYLLKSTNIYLYIVFHMPTCYIEIKHIKNSTKMREHRNAWEMKNKSLTECPSTLFF